MKMILRHSVISIVLSAFVVGCVTSRPDLGKDLLKNRLEKIGFEAVDFEADDTAGVLAYMLNVASVTFAEAPIDEAPYIEQFRAQGITNTITLHLKNVSYLEALHEITKSAGLKYEIQRDRVIFKTRSGVPLND